MVQNGVLHKVAMTMCVLAVASAASACVTALRFVRGKIRTWRSCQWRSKKGPPWRCKKGPLGGCGLVPVVHGRARVRRGVPATG